MSTASSRIEYNLGSTEKGFRSYSHAGVTLAFSKPILDELLSVLARKFAHEREELARVAVFLSSVDELVHPNESLAVLADEPDHRILECVLAASAKCVVTGDRAMLGQNEPIDKLLNLPSIYVMTNSVPGANA